MLPDDMELAADDNRDGGHTLSVAAESSSLEVSSTYSVMRDDSVVSSGVSQQFMATALLGRYGLIERLGAGGFGEVWRGFDPQLKRSVAIKIPRQDRLRGKLQRERFLEEARKLAQIREGVGVVAVYDAGEENDVCYIVTQFVEGRSLDKAIKEATFPRDRAIEIVAQVAEALHRVHCAGFVHRDVKPGNILLDQKEVPYLCDFGLAVTEEQQVHEPPSTVGTRSYMSPEQANGTSHLADARSDVYGLGAVLYELLAGRRPFVVKTNEEYRQQISSREPRMLRTIDDTIPADIERICHKCLAIRPSDRYSTALDLASDLRDWQRKHQPAKANRWRVLLAAIVALGLVPLIAIAVIRFSGVLLPVLAPSDKLFSDKLWRDIPEKAPVVPYVDPTAIPPHWNPGRREATLQSTSGTLFALGEIERLPCTIRLELSGMSAEHPPYFVGLFLGLRDGATEDGTPGKLYQGILLTPESGSDTWRLDRYHMEFKFLSAGFSTHLLRDSIAGQTKLEVNENLKICLTLAEDGLQLLEFDHRKIHRLSAPDANDRTTHPDYLGPFGIYVQGGSVTVRKAQIKYDSP